MAILSGIPSVIPVMNKIAVLVIPEYPGCRGHEPWSVSSQPSHPLLRCRRPDRSDPRRQRTRDPVDCLLARWASRHRIRRVDDNVDCAQHLDRVPRPTIFSARCISSPLLPSSSCRQRASHGPQRCSGALGHWPGSFCSPSRIASVCSPSRGARQRGAGAEPPKSAGLASM